MAYNPGYQPQSGAYSSTYNQAQTPQIQSVPGTPSAYVASSLGFTPPTPSDYQQMTSDYQKMASDYQQQMNYQQHSNLSQPSPYQHVQPNVGAASSVYQTPINPSSVQQYSQYEYQGSQQIYQTQPSVSGVYTASPQSYVQQYTATAPVAANLHYQPPAPGAPHSIHSSRTSFGNVASNSFNQDAKKQGFKYNASTSYPQGGYTPNSKVYKQPKNTVYPSNMGYKLPQNTGYSSNKDFKPTQNYNKGITTPYSQQNSFRNQSRFQNQSNRNDSKFEKKGFLNDPRRRKPEKKPFSCENMHPVSALKQLFPESKFELVCDYQVKGGGASVFSVTIIGATYQGEATSAKTARAFAAANALKGIKANGHEKLTVVANVEEQRTSVLSIIQQWQENQAKKISIKRKGSETDGPGDSKKVKVEEPVGAVTVGAVTVGAVTVGAVAAQTTTVNTVKTLSLLKKIYGHDISEEISEIQSKPTIIFSSTLTVQGFKFTGQGGSKKKARANALDECFTEFEKNPPPYVKKEDSQDKKLAQRTQKTFADKIAAKCSDFVTETLDPAVEAYKKKKNFVVIVKMEGPENEDNLDNCEVVSFGTGTRLAGLQNLAKDGTVIKDSTGESLALRGLRRYLMQQVSECVSRRESIYVRQPVGKYKVKDGIQFIFYTNNCPNGDCRLTPIRNSDTTITPEDETPKKPSKPGTPLSPRFDPQSFDKPAKPGAAKPGAGQDPAAKPGPGNAATVYNSYQPGSKPAPTKPAATPSDGKKTTYSALKSPQPGKAAGVTATDPTVEKMEWSRKIELVTPSRTRNRNQIRNKTNPEDFGKITYDTMDDKLGSLEITQQFKDGVTHVTPSPSDKLAMRSVVGVQGSMLSAISHPVYIRQYLISMRFNTEAQLRALYDRVQGTDLPVKSPYKIEKPLLKHPNWKAALFPDKTSVWGNIWCRGFQAETLYTVRGKKVPTTEVPVKLDGMFDTVTCSESSYSSRSLWAEFGKLCTANKTKCAKKYKDLKYGNSEYNKIKRNVKNHLRKNGHGEWMEHDKYTF